ncbi:fasciclin domain-containing protein [Psychroserpens luteolus]|uniref:fasciclin domain-containing protein n=1 Tax=Psychroserpens luteolus TaxID=2855840 RepID=UPI001E2D2188|nr:fasciclin domain-containing protein [Psychroserpens luteolus]MCD2259749.1 fasciclin domain-containing protein [Psychroserpens luteolus]
MKIISKTFKILPLFLLALVFTSCSDDDDNTIMTPQPMNIVEIALGNSDLTSLVAALQVADGDLVNVLSGSGPFTVLAPTNDAFATFLSANGFSQLSDVPTDVLSQILLNHVISADLTASDLVGLGAGYTSTNALGADGRNMSIYFNTSSGVEFNGVSSVTADGADIDASNGTIHIVDAVIGLPSIVDHALANPGFSNLVAALGAADGNLVDVLSGAGPFTVLAPDDAAFATFLDGTPLGDVPTDALANILLNHVVTGNVASSTLIAGGAGYANTNATGPNDNNLSLYYNTSDGVRFNGVSSVAQADVIGTNGIIHAVDAVIDIPSIVTLATADPNFSTLVTALTTLTPATDFVATLSTANGTSPAPFTVFAPTNDAFDALAAIPAEDVLTQVLLHHVLGDANVQSGDLTDGISPSMLNGQAITINLPGTGDNIADVTDGAGNSDIGIVAVDVQAGNGVIHVLNKVMLPADE